MNALPVQVLLIEDSLSDAELLQEHLALADADQFQVTHVERLEEGLACLRETPFDVVLLDLSLPDSAGLETLVQTQREAPHVPLVVLTGLNNEAMGREAVRRGVQDYLIKGQVDSRQIARSIRYAIERKQAQEALRRAHDELETIVAKRTADLRRANQTLRMISECNQALVQASDEQELIHRICQIISEEGDHLMAWVGLAQNDKEKTVRPVASVGFEDGYLSTIRISWADNDLGRGPTGTAIRSGAVCVVDDFLTDPRMEPWRNHAVRRGFRSSIGLPLNAGGRPFGALTIYTGQPFVFDTNQVSLLTGLADDLSFGITALRARAERDRARKSLEQKTLQLRALTAELAQAEQRERRRVAHILHDHLQQLLVGARYGLESLRGQSDAESLQSSIQHVDGLLAQCFATCRTLTLELSPPILYEAGLPAALHWLGRWFQDTHGLNVEVSAKEEEGPEQEEIRIVLFQAARELLFNVVKHSGVKQAQVRLSHLPNRRVKLVVSDTGDGFDLAQLALGEMTGGFGLFSLRERLEQLGGRLDVESGPGRGSRFTLIVPTVAARPARAAVSH